MGRAFFLAWASTALASFARSDTDTTLPGQHILSSPDYNKARRESLLHEKDANLSEQRKAEGLQGDFPCTELAPSPTVPTSVHALRPSDVKVVAALGDSITGTNCRATSK